VAFVHGLGRQWLSAGPVRHFSSNGPFSLPGQLLSLRELPKGRSGSNSLLVPFKAVDRQYVACHFSKNKNNLETFSVSLRTGTFWLPFFYVL